MNQEDANTYLSVGMAMGTYVMGEIAERGYPMTASMGRQLKESSIRDIEVLLGGSAQLVIEKMSSRTDEIIAFVQQQDEHGA